MRKSEAIEYFGSATAVARALGIGKAFVSKWGVEVPPRYQYELERLTKGDPKGGLKADWPPRDRPNMPRARGVQRAPKLEAV
jgi:DNA-binding transcriptional regulator YdaS (Cro superfamily)